MDHRAMCGQIGLTMQQEAWLKEGVARDSQLQRPQRADSLTPLHKRVTVGIKLCRNAKERAFVEALVVHFTHKLVNCHEPVLKATRDQLRQIIEDRHGIKLDNSQFNRHKKKYITRPDKPATRYELAIQTVKGKPGTPSEYELTGLLHLLSPEAAQRCLAASCPT